MSGRTEILNKRLDMLRELLDVLQQQMENVHAVKLEWIVIYLIMAEVLLQGLAIVSKLQNVNMTLITVNICYFSVLKLVVIYRETFSEEFVQEENSEGVLSSYSSR